MSDEEPGFREDCDRECSGYWRKDSDGRPTSCCGGCPVQCYCRLEREADDRASREEAYYYNGYDDETGYGDSESQYGDGPGA